MFISFGPLLRMLKATQMRIQSATALPARPSSRTTSTFPRFGGPSILEKEMAISARKTCSMMQKRSRATVSARFTMARYKNAASLTTPSNMGLFQDETGSTPQGERLQLDKNQHLHTMAQVRTPGCPLICAKEGHKRHPIAYLRRSAKVARRPRAH